MKIDVNEKKIFILAKIIYIFTHIFESEYILYYID